MTRISMVSRAVLVSSVALVACGQDTNTTAMDTGNMAVEVDSSTWPASEEAVVAAPQNHEVLYEDNDLRLLSVSVAPGEVEPFHHHTMPSILIIDASTTAVDHLPDGSQHELPKFPPDAQKPVVIVRGPEPAHSFENTDTEPFHLYRLEFKNLEFDNLRGIMEQVQAQL